MNEQIYEPNYIYWYEKEFRSDIYVARIMQPLDRHFYRALIIESHFCSTRPYLPNDDEQLWVMADAQNKEQWLEHKNVVMKKFTLTKDENFWGQKRVLADWQTMLDADTRHKVGSHNGGSSTSEAKQQASRENGKRHKAKGGLGSLGEISQGNPRSQATILDSTQRNNTELDLTDTHTHTHKPASVCVGNPLATMLENIPAEMLSSSFKQKPDEKQQLEELVTTHGWEKVVAAVHLYCREQGDPHFFAKTTYKWTAFLYAASAWLGKVTEELLHKLQRERWYAIPGNAEKAEAAAADAHAAYVRKTYPSTETILKANSNTDAVDEFFITQHVEQESYIADQKKAMAEFMRKEPPPQNGVDVRELFPEEAIICEQKVQ